MVLIKDKQLQLIKNLLLLSVIKLLSVSYFLQTNPCRAKTQIYRMMVSSRVILILKKNREFWIIKEDCHWSFHWTSISWSHINVTKSHSTLALIQGNSQPVNQTTSAFKAKHVHSYFLLNQSSDAHFTLWICDYHASEQNWESWILQKILIDLNRTCFVYTEGKLQH